YRRMFPVWRGNRRGPRSPSRPPAPKLSTPGGPPRILVKSMQTSVCKAAKGVRPRRGNGRSGGGGGNLAFQPPGASALCTAARQRCAGRAMRARAALLAGTALVGASLALATGAQAQTVINVTVANDPGTTSAGTTGGAGTLSAALAQINASVAPPGGFVINLQ